MSDSWHGGDGGKPNRRNFRGGGRPCPHFSSYGRSHCSTRSCCPWRCLAQAAASQCCCTTPQWRDASLRVSWQAAEATAADSCERDDGGARPSAGGLSVGGGGGGGSWRSLYGAGFLNFVIFILLSLYSVHYFIKYVDFGHITNSAFLQEI